MIWQTFLRVVWYSIFGFALAQAANSKEVATTAPRLTVSKRTTEPLLRSEKPWEDWCLGYCQVIRAGDRWQMWYGSFDHKYQNDADCYLCYATSDDGVRWVRPELGLTEYNGSTRNNILLHAGVVGATVFLDEQAPADERYKLVFTKYVGDRWPVFGGTSADGVHWKLGEKPLLDYNSDTQQACVREPDGYRLFVRMWSGPQDFEGVRLVGASFSKSFGAFPTPRPVVRADEKDPAGMQFYNSGITKVRDGLYIMLPSGFYKGEDVSRLHAAVSFDGEHFERIGPRPLVDLGQTFDHKALYAAPGAVPAEKPGQYWAYYIGSAAPHDQPSTREAKRAGGIGRFLLTIEE